MSPKHWHAEIAASAPFDSRSTLVREPDAATKLVFRTTPDRRSDLLVLGPRTRASYHRDKADLPICTTVRFTPGRAHAVLGVPINELVDRIVNVIDLWGEAGDRLTRRLADAGDDPTLVLKQLESALTARLESAPGKDFSRGELIQTAINELSAEPVGIASVARRLGVSERHLRNLFAVDVGVSPKHFARINRVRAVVARADQHQLARHGALVRLARLAPETGYYDQSHMTAEFRDLMGVPPGAFIAGRFPAPQRCQSTK